MGNRAIITTEDFSMSMYLHWQGGRDSVEPFLDYCRLRGFRSPETDCYGWARLAQVVCNFMGSEGLSCGIAPYSRGQEPMSDNGDYVIRNWEIVERRCPWEDFEEQAEYDHDEMLHAIDRAQPKAQQLGAYLDAVVLPTSEVRVGDVAYMQNIGTTPKACEVLGRAKRPGSFGHGEELPFVKLYENDGHYDTNPNNFLSSKTARIVPRS
ncbi:MAG: hypothetical protein RR842_04825 [Gordonibacter sp.]|uniref:hypothetical protein n=1 Tax=Gordonibacter sp. TaxID=1968902 RepID=UPI002B366025|nr:hypothetical protein [Gordonibacter sp.]